MTLIIDKKCLEKIENLKHELKGMRKDLAREDLKRDISSLKESLKEYELKKKIETERLIQKLYDNQNIKGKVSELKGSTDLSKKDRFSIDKTPQKDVATTCSKDEVEISEEALSELIGLTEPNEGDMERVLEEMGLKHLIKKK
ncbi:MAG: hypothetical protein OIN88_02375 [Candidatus Methanoperedens sp.]|nr:hypothetical protein [Candidatus Methanoperedens sp.]MCZ7359237.1 hypothetical protein [Candidatus Methanoperedens sp.]HLB71448.1 hypothetical protein [Candidatus Methanoperedens sp.]